MSALVVLAAGAATRFGGPKQLEPVGPSDELLLEYALYDAWRAGCRSAVVVTRAELAARFQREVAPHWAGRLDLQVVVQRLDDAPLPVPAGRARPWGTAHALRAARSAVSGPVLACNADDFYGPGAFRALAARAAEGGQGVAGYPLARTLSPHGGVSRAICHADRAGRLLRIEERTGIIRRGDVIADDRGDVFPPDIPVSMNLWALGTPFLAALEDAFTAFLRDHGGEDASELRIPDVVNERVGAGSDVRVVSVQEEWFGMTYAADLSAVRERLAARVSAGEYPVNLRAV